MTQTEALKLALEAIEDIHRTGDTQVFDMYYAEPVIAAIKEALAQHNEFNPDWDAMAVMVEEQQRMAKRIAELEALRMALEALERQTAFINNLPVGRREKGDYILAIPEAAWIGLTSCVHAIKEALAQPEQEFGDLTAAYMTGVYDGKNQRTWVGLTDEEIDKTHETMVWDARRSYARAIEAKLKEKNNG